MTPARRAFLSGLLSRAWSIWRARDLPGVNCASFADALRRAWAWEKAATDRAEADARYRSAPARATVQLRSMLQSPIRRGLTGKAYANGLFRDAGRVTSALGC